MLPRLANGVKSELALGEMDVEFPLLGQALPIELSNTRWVHGGREIDAIATVGGTRRWVAAIAPRMTVRAPAVDEGLRAELVTLRETVRSVLAATIAGERPSADTLALLNAAARAVPTWWELRWESDPPPRGERAGLVARRRRQGSPAGIFLASLAEDAMALAAGEDAGRLRACTGPGCLGLYMQDKPQRRFCSPTCATRARAARHYERHRRASHIERDR